MEIWKLWAEGYESYSGRNHSKKQSYKPIYISNLGNIRGRETRLDSKGYLSFQYKGITFRLHHQVAKLFIDNPENKRCVDHINTIRTDNRVENLRWVSHKENSNNKITKEKMINNHADFNGSSNPRARKVQCVETGEIFGCAKLAADKYNVSKCLISNAANYNRKACGYNWKYLS
jgi:hypothetical protein